MSILEKYEADIEAFEQGYAKGCLAILAISEGDIWAKGSYRSFEDYCWVRWRYKKARAYQLLSAGKLLLTLKESTVVDPPPNERICREVMKAKVWEEIDGRWYVDEEKTPQKQIDTWEMVSSQLNGSTMTAEDVRVLVDRSCGRGIKSGPSLAKRKKQALSQLGRAMDRFCAIDWTAGEKRTYGEQVRKRVTGW